jgi:hypothetical protein
MNTHGNYFGESKRRPVLEHTGQPGGQPNSLGDPQARQR